jgi:hypothetical protein
MQAQMKQQTAMLEAQLGKIEDAALFSELAPTSDAFSFELLPSM